MAKKEKQKSYLSQLAATAPAFAAKTILGDVPRSALESVVEQQAAPRFTGGQAPPITASLKSAIKNRGYGALKGGAAGLLTAPIFVSGLKDVASDDKKDKAKGYGKILGTGAAFQAVKGYQKGLSRGREMGLSPGRARGMGRSMSLSRAVTKAPGALGLAYAVSQGLKKKKKGDKPDKYQTAKLLGTGALVGGGQSVVDVLADATRRQRSIRKVLGTFGNKARLRALAAPALGGAVAGSLGAYATSKAVKGVLGKKKHAFLWDKKKSEKKSVDMEVPPSMKEWFKPYPHQAKAVRNLMNNDGKVLLAHEMGTGKTVSSIYGVELLKSKGTAKKTLVIVPTGLRENFAKDGLKKFMKDPKYQIVASSSEKGREGYARPDKLDPNAEYTIVGYEMFTRYHKEILDRVGADTIIADEFHKARNESSGVWKTLLSARPRVKNFIGLTASMVNNDPKEVASLLTVVEGQRLMSPKQFSKAFTRTVGVDAASGKKIKGVKDHAKMLRMVDPSVNYASTNMLKGKTMPKKEVSFVDVPMSDDQYQLYQLALDKLGPLKEYVVTKDPKVKAKVDNKTLFAQLSKARQISNAVHMGREMELDRSASDTPKVRKMLDDAFDHLQTTPDGKVVLYSNLVRGGVDVLSAGLKARGINHAMFVGKGSEIDGQKITSKVRDQGVEDYKKGKVKAIIISGAGAEGLNLPNSTAFFSLDGHFNPERIMQAEARARRLGGQSHRPEDKRRVIVKRYRSIVPTSKRRGFFAKAIGLKDPQTTDQWVYSTAKRKYLQNKSFYDTLEQKHKYIRKYRDKKGNIRYEYQKKPSGVLGGLFRSKKDYIDD